MTKNKKKQEEIEDFNLHEGEEILHEDDLEIHDEIVEEEEEEKEEEIIVHKVAVSAPLKSIPTSEYKYRDDLSFEQNLKDFFSKNRKSKLKYASILAEKFKGKEIEVMDYLYHKYVTRVNAIIQKRPIPKYKGLRHH